MSRNGVKAIPCEDHLCNKYDSIKDMCTHYGVRPDAYWHRIKLGWSKEDALTTPVKMKTAKLPKDVDKRFGKRTKKIAPPENKAKITVPTKSGLAVAEKARPRVLTEGLPAIKDLEAKLEEAVSEQASAKEFLDEAKKLYDEAKAKTDAAKKALDAKKFELLSQAISDSGRSYEEALTLISKKPLF